MSEESRRVLELDTSYEVLPDTGDLEELLALAPQLARQVEALEAGRGDIVACLRDVLSLTNLKTEQVGLEEATAILNRARIIVRNYDAIFGRHDQEPPK